MNAIRRKLLSAGAMAGSLAAVIGSSLITVGRAVAAPWNKGGFEAKDAGEAQKSVGGAGAAESKDILIKAPDIAENGAVVPVEVTSRIPNTQSISIIAEKNPFPLVATFEFSGGAEGFASTRMKLGQTSDVRAIVRTADGKAYFAKKEVKVTIGGCGG